MAGPGEHASWKSLVEALESKLSRETYCTEKSHTAWLQTPDGNIMILFFLTSKSCHMGWVHITSWSESYQNSSNYCWQVLT